MGGSLPKTWETNWVVERDLGGGKGEHNLSFSRWFENYLPPVILLTNFQYEGLSDWGDTTPKCNSTEVEKA